MSDLMKRKQFHLTVAEEKILYEIAKKNNVSEAEVVRMAIQEYGKNNLIRENSLVKMAKAVQCEGRNDPDDQSENHDQYLAENDDHEKP